MLGRRREHDRIRPGAALRNGFERKAPSDERSDFEIHAISRKPRNGETRTGTGGHHDFSRHAEITAESPDVAVADAGYLHKSPHDGLFVARFLREAVAKQASETSVVRREKRIE